MRNLVIVPTFNERENIIALIESVLGLQDFDILVVDDNSPDGTASMVKQAMADYPGRVDLIERSGKMGLGTAYIAGFKYGIQKGYDFLYEMDADFSHDPNDLVRLRQAVDKGADVAIGSRYTPGGGFKNWPKDRILISKGGSAFVRCIMSIPVKDPTAGFICYRSEVLQAMNLDKIEFTGYGFQIEMKYVAWRLGFRLVEVPIVFKDREKGTSKMHIGIIREAIWGVLKLRFRNISAWYAAKVAV